MIILLKFAIAIVLIAMTSVLIYLRKSGKEARHRHPVDVSRHKRGADALLWSTLLLVALVLALEWEVRGSDFVAPATPLLAFHLLGAGLFFTLLLCMRFYITGIRFPLVHGRSGRWVLIPSFTLMSITGVVLLWHI